MESYEKLLSIISLMFILSGTLLMIYSDKKKIKTDPHYGLYKFVSYLRKDAPIDSITTHERLYFPHNRRMKRIYILGIALLIVGTGFGIAAIII